MLAIVQSCCASHFSEFPSSKMNQAHVSSLMLCLCQLIFLAKQNVSSIMCSTKLHFPSFSFFRSDGSFAFLWRFAETFVTVRIVTQQDNSSKCLPCEAWTTFFTNSPASCKTKSLSYHSRLWLLFLVPLLLITVSPKSSPWGWLYGLPRVVFETINISPLTRLAVHWLGLPRQCILMVYGFSNNVRVVFVPCHNPTTVW